MTQLSLLLRVMGGGLMVLPDPLITTVLGAFLIYLSFAITRKAIGASLNCGCDFHRFGGSQQTWNFLGKRRLERRYHA